MTRIVTITAALLGSLTCSVGSAACLHYDGSPVVLTGVVIKRTFYGPPGYGESPKDDTRETQALLRLDAPLCVDSSDPGEIYDRADNQHEITLIPNWKHIKPYLGRRVEVTGTLSGALTGHHHTDVLMTVKRIKVLG
jgi:Domain of unknown function (DUF4431)